MSFMRTGVAVAVATILLISGLALVVGLDRSAALFTLFFVGAPLAALFTKKTNDNPDTVLQPPFAAALTFAPGLIVSVIALTVASAT